MIKLDKRLNCIASMVNQGDIVADIGTDHGYLPIYLCTNNISPFAYACDIAEMPLKKAQENIEKYHLENKIKTLLTDGIKELPDNIHTILIAGMGGHLIAKIIENCNYNTLILQPNLHAEVVRNALVNNGYKIIDEKIIKIHHKFYEIIKAIKGEGNYSFFDIKYGPCNLKEKSENFILKYKKRIDILNEAKKNININSLDYKKIIEELEELKEIIKK